MAREDKEGGKGAEAATLLIERRLASGPTFRLISTPAGAGISPVSAVELSLRLAGKPGCRLAWATAGSDTSCVLPPCFGDAALFRGGTFVCFLEKMRKILYSFQQLY